MCVCVCVWGGGGGGGGGGGDDYVGGGIESLFAEGWGEHSLVSHDQITPSPNHSPLLLSTHMHNVMHTSSQTHIIILHPYTYHTHQHTPP